MGSIHMIFVFIGALFRRQAELAAENLALRQQLAALEHKSKRPRLRKRDRIFWVWLSRLWSGWRYVLAERYEDLCPLRIRNSCNIGSAPSFGIREAGARGGGLLSRNILARLAMAGWGQD